MSIPVIICPVLNGPELLDRMLDSIDYPVDRVVVVDNGDTVDAHLGGRRLTPYKFHVIKPGWNLGVSASWNLGIKANPLADWWLIVNHDIEFGLGDLAALDAQVEPRSSSTYKMSALAAFAITPPAIRAAGFADENFIVAYDEDLDWERRMALAGVRIIDARFTGSHVGSATIGSNPTYRHLNGQSHGANDRYYQRKWGGLKEGGETFSTPFDRGDLTAWSLDIDLLRQFTWPRNR